jgi:formylglycine-generating enzyme required for sulfatase activity/serine/threonine protein kinase
MSERRVNLNPGHQVAEFQVERVLSLSPRSAVYLVSDLNLDKRFVLKECLPLALVTREDSGPLTAIPGCERELDRTVADFRSACRLQARLDHPNIPRMLRYFEMGNTAYCLMDWLPGATMAALIERSGSLPLEKTRDVITQLASALDYLHESDLMHLALEPAHVYLADDGQMLLLDFLAAAQVHSNQWAADQPAPWSAPECLAGMPSPTPAADIFALCSLAYFALTGVPPVSPAERLRTLAAGQGDPLPTLISQVQREQLGGLGDAIDLGLRLDPGRRPASITAWRQAYESIDWRRRIAQEAPAEVGRERPEWLSPLLLGAFLTAIVATAGFLLFGSEPAATPEPAMLPTEQAPVPSIPAEETRQWQAALRADTVTAYRQFLQAFPQSSYAGQAQIQLDILDERAWNELAAEDTLLAYQHYLERFPSGIHQAEALRRIDRFEQALAAAERARIERERQDDRAWQTARETATVTSVEAYLAAWPGGRYADAARELRNAIKSRELEDRAWSAAVQLNQREAYQAYLDAYPDGEHSAEALISLEHLDLAPGKAFRDCADCPAMVVLPPGEFWQGSSPDDSLASGNEQPRHLVNIGRPFAIGVHEVTFAQWEACVSAGGCSHQPADNGWGRGNRPVIMVSWNDAQEYVNWLSETTRQSYRLPSESEWEYAARAGEEGPWPGGSPEAMCRFANIAGAETDFQWRLEACADQHVLGTQPVGTRTRNAFGLHDVIGNVAEWTADCMNISYLDAPSDGSAWNRGICSSHMTRGGSWVTGARESRLSARFHLDSGDRNDFTGLRVVRDVEE